jgi:hypothetical protein
MNYTNVKAMLIQPDEAAALEKAEQTLRDVQFALGGENTIMALETGEVITPGELARVRAILDFIRNYRMVEINPN